MYVENPLKHNSHVEMIRATIKFIFLEFVLCLYRIYLLYSITKNIRTIKRLFSLQFYKIEKYDKYWFIPLHSATYKCFLFFFSLAIACSVRFVIRSNNGFHAEFFYFFLFFNVFLPLLTTVLVSKAILNIFLQQFDHDNTYYVGFHE